MKSPIKSSKKDNKIIKYKNEFKYTDENLRKNKYKKEIQNSNKDEKTKIEGKSEIQIM